MNSSPGSYTLPVQTEHGFFLAHYSAKGLCALNFPRKRNRDGPGKDDSAIAPAEVMKWHETTTAALKKALSGKAARALPPLDVSEATEFQREVWKGMLTLGPGKTCSYSDLARKIG